MELPRSTVLFFGSFSTSPKHTLLLIITITSVVLLQEFNIYHMLKMHFSFIFTLLACLLCINLCFSLKVSDANDDQYAFLSELYDLTSGEMWVNNTNWLVHNENITLCNWYGIVCSGKWVQKLELKSNGLGGPLPDKWERVPYLESIDLSNNK